MDKPKQSAPHNGFEVRYGGMVIVKPSVNEMCAYLLGCIKESEEEIEKLREKIEILEDAFADKNTEDFCRRNKIEVGI